ncbi:hypothetical protein PUNSTDRAFT_44761 [Punctularia strigosozonata HHB-11173 SS5]|uniref:uncharacterized protein n=1 Tax=Punctularia strigosozonata (strain HHB-11173) TaxID=741275 RepID=UPI000441799D|nr:uncharacterized protein PUNSTDRAFT_44761 [Punctularia strigosozonata HHB-11173 SS5]EIN08172.1 hypothetical protein PUNSTDRAFT_44761 [Punctularia strigosozonata HHB-11173 SS5]
MATETQSQPQITIIQRIGSIPLVSDGLSTLHNTLSTNAYTASPYAHAQDFTEAGELQAISKTALGYTAPIQSKLAPILVKADGYANQVVDAVESRYPYPFKAHADDIVKDLKGRSDAAKGVATKTIDDKVTAIDSRFAPLVDYMEVYVNQLAPSPSRSPTTTTSTSGPSSPVEGKKYQYQRAIDLSKNLRDSLYVYSNEHIKQLQSQSVLVQRATATADSITKAASAQYASAHGRVTALSDTMLSELQSIKAQTAELPTQLQSTLHSLTTELGTTIHQLSAIISAKDLPPKEKFQQVTTTVQTRVQPLLDATTARISAILDQIAHRKEQGEKKATDAVEIVKETVDTTNVAEKTGVSYAEVVKTSDVDESNGASNSSS